MIATPVAEQTSITSIEQGSAGISLDPKSEPAFFPTRVGTKWVLATGEGKDEVELSHVVTAVEQEAGETLISVGIVRGKDVEPHSKVLITKDGVFEVEFKGKEIEGGYCLFRTSARVGESWTVNTVKGRSWLKMTKTRRETEKVKVPAGQYEADRIEVKHTLEDGKTSTLYHWFAPEVGFVKSELEDGTLVLQLKSFEMGKK